MMYLDTLESTEEEDMLRNMLYEDDIIHNTVCPQSPFGVLKNCGDQTNWASHMRFVADYSETLEVFYWPQ
jgi:hypothetical protein